MAPRGINRPGYSSPRTPTGINRPGYSSPKAPTGIQRPGYSSAPSPKPSPRPSGSPFSAPTGINRPGYSPSQGGGGISPLQQTREKFFDNRYDVSTDRLRRRRQQEEQLKLFKDMYTRPVAGSSNLLQMTQDAPMSLGDYTQKLAFELGPTPRELMSDVSYAAKSIGQGLMEKGTPMMNLAKSLFGGVQNLFTGPGGQGTTAQGPQNLGLTPGQMNIYNNLVGNGMNPAMALEQAKRYMPNFANGGIATLH